MTYENWKLEQAEPILFEGKTNYTKREVEKPTWLLKAENKGNRIKKMDFMEMEQLIKLEIK